MAAKQFLDSHGIAPDALLQGDSTAAPENAKHDSTHILKIINARLPNREADTLWDISVDNGQIASIDPPSSSLNTTHLPSILDASGGLVTPSFCHAHVHLDKCFLLHDPKYSDLQIMQGDFAEAMSLTNQAKQRFDKEDLLRRGRRLIDESVEAGITAMRAFVEVDEIVGLKCVDAGLMLKEEYRDVCHVQVCAFAQLALFSGKDGAKRRRELFEEAVQYGGVEVVGSTPYVEGDWFKMKENVTWTIEMALRMQKHLDLHLDYNLDGRYEPLVWFVLEELHRLKWNENAIGKTVCLGHCTRLTLFSGSEWRDLRDEIGDLPIHFVGQPTSDLFMMGRDGGTDQRPRGTLQIPRMIQDHGLNGTISINNVGNAFTPQGTCDPLALASLGVAVYQTGTKEDTELIYELISKRAFEAIGLPYPMVPAMQADSFNEQVADQTHVSPPSGDVKSPADLIIFSPPSMPPHRRPLTISEAVYAGGAKYARRTVHKGRLVTS